MVEATMMSFGTHVAVRSVSENKYRKIPVVEHIMTQNQHLIPVPTSNLQWHLIKPSDILFESSLPLTE